jgi:hypothetical protein
MQTKEIPLTDSGHVVLHNVKSHYNMHSNKSDQLIKAGSHMSQLRRPVSTHRKQ